MIRTKITIEGTEYTDPYGISVTSSTGENNSSSTCMLTFPNENGLYSGIFSQGNEVIIYADKDATPTTRRFCGIIRYIGKTGKPSVKQDLKITARDYSSKLQDAGVDPEVYNNQTIDFILRDLCAKYADWLDLTNVQVCSKEIPRIVFIHEKLFDAIQRLATYAGFIWYVDVNKVLNFIPKESVSSGVTLDQNNVQESNFTETTDQDFYNQVTVYGNNMLTGVRQQFTPDGGSVFLLYYRPSNTTVGVNGTTKIGGVDTFVGAYPSGTQYVVNYYDRTVTFLSGTACGNNIPGSNVGSVVIDYQREKQIIKYTEDPESIGSYWPVDTEIVDTTIKDPDEAMQVAKSYLIEHSNPRTQGTTTLYGMNSIIAGNTVIVDLPNKGITLKMYSVVNVKYDFSPANLKAETVMTLTLNKKISDITDTMKQILLKLKRQEANQIQNDIISRLVVGNENVEFSDHEWNLYNNQIGMSLVFDHPINGKLGLIDVPSGLMMSGAQFSTGSNMTGMSSAYFPGSAGNGIAVANGSMWGNNMVSGITVTAWVMPLVDQPVGSTPTIISHTNDVTNPIVRVDLNGTAGPMGSIRFMAYNLGSSAIFTQQTTGSYVFSGGWSHIACAWQSGGTPKIYHNGSMISSGAAVGGLIGSQVNVPTNIGWNKASLIREYVGWIDDVRIYNRELAASEIGSIARGFTILSGLQFWADFEETTGSTTYIANSGSVQPLIGDHRTIILDASGIESYSEIPLFTSEHGLGFAYTSSDTECQGEKILIGSHPLKISSIIRAPSCTATTARLRTSFSGSNLYSATFVGSVATFSTPPVLSQSTNYYLMLDSNGASYTVAYNTPVVHPVAGSLVTWVASAKEVTGEFTTYSINVLKAQFYWS